ncbi:MAG TPA: nucleotidyltransferase domain-containing protein [Thermoanaerobaculia bacterium]|nr:nucleotidyltransferase domain-containing protein [Thermoanaerobaculia bacterium]
MPLLKWPERAEVVAGLRQWAERQKASHPELVRVGYFGSLNDGVRYGVWSDADVVFVVQHSSREHWYQRPLDFDRPNEVPVPVDLFVYTEDEFAEILGRGDAFAHDMQHVVWL